MADAVSVKPRRNGATHSHWIVFTPSDREMLTDRCQVWGDGRISDSKYVRFDIRNAYDVSRNPRLVGLTTQSRAALTAIQLLIGCEPISAIAFATAKSSKNIRRYITDKDDSNLLTKDLYRCFHPCASLIDELHLITTANSSKIELKFRCKNAASAAQLLGRVVSIKRMGAYVSSSAVQDWTTDPSYAGTSGFLYEISSSNYGGGAGLSYAGYLVPYSVEEHQARYDAETIETAITGEHEAQAEHENRASEYNLNTSANNYHKEEIDNGTTMWKTLRYIGLGVIIMLLIPVVLSFFKKQKGKK